MGIRENIGKNQRVTTIITVGVIVLAAAFAAYSIWPSAPMQQTKTYFTTDEGKTWFVDSVVKAVPFQHEGKTAYRLRLFTCDGGQTKFPGYVMRYTPEGQKRLAAAVEEAKKSGAPVATALTALTPTDIEIRALGGDSNPWISIGDRGRAARIRDVKCPPGQPGPPDTVEP